MIQKFVKWYVKKFLCEYTLLKKDVDYFLKAELDQAFERVRKREEEKQNERHTHEVMILRDRLEREHFLEITEMENELKNVKEERDIYKTQQKEVNALQNRVITKAQDCVALVTAASMRINMLRDTFADHSGTMLKVKSDLEGVYLELGVNDGQKS